MTASACYFSAQNVFTNVDNEIGVVTFSKKYRTGPPGKWKRPWPIRVYIIMSKA